MYQGLKRTDTTEAKKLKKLIKQARQRKDIADYNLFEAADRFASRNHDYVKTTMLKYLNQLCPTQAPVCSRTCPVRVERAQHDKEIAAKHRLRGNKTSRR
ncbi:hypothetical protein FJ365_00250 [Candidatus Dependentiae bacterium]|nr:hypothetical protein [Candidatus Dependentiae bacterium]